VVQRQRPCRARASVRPSSRLSHCLLACGARESATHLTTPPCAWQSWSDERSRPGMLWLLVRHEMLFFTASLVEHVHAALLLSFPLCALFPPCFWRSGLPMAGWVGGVCVCACMQVKVEIAANDSHPTPTPSLHFAAAHHHLLFPIAAGSLAHLLLCAYHCLPLWGQQISLLPYSR
jgi:hypothetical protein